MQKRNTTNKTVEMCKKLKISKIILNRGLNCKLKDSNILSSSLNELSLIAGQKPTSRKAKKAIAAFQVRETSSVGVSLTLRGKKKEEFLSRLVLLALPRIRDFQGLNANGFDGFGNYSFGLNNQLMFPEIQYEDISTAQGLNITFVTNTALDAEALKLLLALGLPFRT